MNVKIFKCATVVAAMVMAFASSQVQAATVLPLLQNGENQLEDDDFESFVLDSGTLGVLDVGDRFVGVFRVSAINGTGVAANGQPTVTAVFALELLSKEFGPAGSNAGNATSVLLGFGPLQGGGVNDAIAQWAGLGPTLALLGLGDMPAINSDDTMAILYDFPDWGTTDEAAASAIDTFDDDAGGVPIAEFGFTGTYSTTSHMTGIDEFWQTTGQMNADPLTIPGVQDLDADEPGDIEQMLQGGIGPTNLISVNVTYMYPYPITINGTSAVFPAFLPTDLQATGVFVQDSQQPSGVFNLSTDTDIVMDLSVVPEPASWLIFTGLFGAAVAARRRRRKS